nr:hypothetical protein [uncultured Flavobacterium sp.]
MGFTNDIKEQKDLLRLFAIARVAFLGDMEPALRFIFLSRPKRRDKKDITSIRAKRKN